MDQIPAQGFNQNDDDRMIAIGFPNGRRGQARNKGFFQRGIQNIVGLGWIKPNQQHFVEGDGRKFCPCMRRAEVSAKGRDHQGGKNQPRPHGLLHPARRVEK